jgi:hypothetical protein
MRRRGELSPAGIDRGWPHQVALPARFCENGGYKEIHDFCVGLSLCTRGHSVCDDEWFHVYCFADADHAKKFQERFGGVTFDPSQRGIGASSSLTRGVIGVSKPHALSSEFR